MATLISGSTLGLPVKHCSRCDRELLYFQRPHFERREVATETGTAYAQERTETPMLARCECEIARERRSEEQRIAREKQEWIDRAIKHGKIEPRFAGSRFEGWEHSPATEAAYQAAMKCAQEVSADEHDCGLIILGNVGNGKNTLAACVCRYVAEHYRTFAYQSVPGLLQSLRDTYDSEDGERESSILRALTGCDLLVLNDWGAEKWTEWTESKMYYVVDNAYSEKRNIVVTTNAVKMRREEGDPPGSALIDLMSVRIYDRLIQMCHFVTNEGGSYRRKVAAQNRKGR